MPEPNLNPSPGEGCDPWDFGGKKTPEINAKKGYSGMTDGDSSTERKHVQVCPIFVGVPFAD